MCMAADIQFIKGINEPSIPDVNLTRSRDGATGTATFVFNTPSIFEASSELGDITGEISCCDFTFEIFSDYSESELHVSVVVRLWNLDTLGCRVHFQCLSFISSSDY